MATIEEIKQKISANETLTEDDFAVLKNDYYRGGKAAIDTLVSKRGGISLFAKDFGKVEYKQEESATITAAFSNPGNKAKTKLRDEFLLDYFTLVSVQDSPTPFQDYATGGGSSSATAFLDAVAIKEAVEEDGIFGNTFLNTPEEEDIRSGDLARAVGNTPPPADDPASASETSEIKPSEALQCLLLKNLGALSKTYKTALRRKIIGDAGEFIAYPYRGKIININSDPSTNFINNLTLQRNLNPYFSQVHTKNTFIDEKNKLAGGKLPQSVTTRLRISFIKQQNVGDTKSLIELPFLQSARKRSKGSDGQANSYYVSDDIVGQARLKDEKSILKKLNWELNIKYEGTNPATYRNDVAVEFKITAPSIESFTKTWQYEDIDKKFNLFDLILFPYYETDSEGYGRIFKSQFSPNYNRIRLYLGSSPSGRLKKKFKEFYNKNSTVLDLTPYEHDFKREAEGQQYSLTVKYRGYVQSLLTTPELDALSSPDIKAKRKGRDDALKQAAATGCGLEEMRRISELLLQMAENDPKTITEEFVSMFNGRNIEASEGTQAYPGFGFWSIPASDLDSTIGGGGDEIDFETLYNAIRTNTGKSLPTPSESSLESTALGTTPSATSSRSISGNSTSVLPDINELSFFYLADLLDVILKNTQIYKNQSSLYDETSNEFYNQNLRFIMGSFEDPKTKQHINLGHVPISFQFFKEWYQETVLDKELFLYPALSMIRDLVERVVTNLLSEVCYQVDESNRNLVRVAFFTGVGGTKEQNDKVFQFWKTKYKDSDNSDVYINEDSAGLPLISPSFNKTVSEHINYCVIYVTGPQSGFNNSTLSNTPHFYLDNSNYLGPSSFSFERTTEPYQREARYFRNSASGITQLAGVYSTTLDLAIPMYTIYPSTFYKLTLGKDSYNIPDTNIDLFTELGINGYYAIKSVNITLNGGIDAPEDKFTISGIWQSSELPFSELRQPAAAAETFLHQRIAEEVLLNCNNIIDGIETSIQAGMGLGNIDGTPTLEQIIADQEQDAAERADMQRQTEEISRRQQESNIQSQEQIIDNTQLAEQLATIENSNFTLGSEIIIRETSRNGVYIADAEEYKVRIVGQGGEGEITVFNSEDQKIGVYKDGAFFEENQQSQETE